MFTKQLIKYSIVGTAGTLIDVTSLFVFVEYIHLPLLLATSLSFFLALLNNFLWNRYWTFRVASTNYRKLFIKFSIVSLIGLLLTNLSMYLLVSVFQIWYILAKLLTSAIVMMWNFLGNKHWSFNQKIRPLFTQGTLDLSIVIPAYNEERRLPKTVQAIHDYLQRHPHGSFELILVNDGSTDCTQDVMNKLVHTTPYTRTIQQLKNTGKGWSVRTGVLEARGNTILMLDADGSTPIESLAELSHALENADIAIGSRYLHDSKIGIQQSKLRARIGRLGNTLIRLLILDGIQDTQCGFKLFTREAAFLVFPKQRVRRWGFDMEILAIATVHNLTIKEVPVAWNNAPFSRLRPIRDALKTFSELLYIKLNLLSGRYQD